jgi:nitrite reductase/ring-hydroxylating ferredoxin subunit
MLSREDSELLTRVGPGTPMGELMRRYWVPVVFSHQIPKPDCPPVRAKLLGENLVAFRDTSGKPGLVAEACPHRLASLFFGRNEDNGLRCVYHGIKFDRDGNCMDVPCIAPGTTTETQMKAIKRQMRIKAYPCEERGDLVWAYMGPAQLMPEFPELEWAHVAPEQRFATRHVQECNWLQGLDGGFDAAHLSFLHSGAVDARKGNTDQHRRIVPSRYHVFPIDSGFACTGGRDIGDGSFSWHVEIMLMPFHKIIPSVPKAAHIWMPMDDENTMLYSVNFDPFKPFTAEELERETSWRGIHTENVTGTDRPVLNKDNDYLIDRELQASGRSFTGLNGLGVQDCGMQESMGPIVDRTQEHLLPCDAALSNIRQLLLRALRDHMAGKVPPGLKGTDYRVRSARFDSPLSNDFEALVRDSIRIETPRAAE